MGIQIEAFAEITCPFAHVGLKVVTEALHQLAEPPPLVVRPWPLEWVNGSGLDALAVALKAKALDVALGRDDFGGFDPTHWPVSTIAAHNLVAAAYAEDAATGLSVSLELRTLLFERGIDIGDPQVLAELAASHELAAPPAEPTPAMQDAYEDGRRRGVRGSPEFFVGAQPFFCPSLELGHDDAGSLTASFDPAGLRALVLAAATG